MHQANIYIVLIYLANHPFPPTLTAIDLPQLLGYRWRIRPANIAGDSLVFLFDARNRTTPALQWTGEQLQASWSHSEDQVHNEEC